MKRISNGRRLTDTKESNPKEAFGDAKVPMDLVPDTALIEENLAFLEGALKYGGYNYRVAGVKVSTYVRAARRHLAKFWNGQDRDPVTLVMELASVRACCGILIDGLLKRNITDDRPPRADIEAQMVEAAKVVAHLKQLFKDHHPPQYTQLEHGVRMIEAPPGHTVRHDLSIVPAGTTRAKLDRAVTRGLRAAYVGTGIRPGDTPPPPTRRTQSG